MSIHCSGTIGLFLCVALIMLSEGEASAEELELVCRFPGAHLDNTAPPASDQKNADRVYVIDTQRRTAMEVSEKAVSTGRLAFDESIFTLTIPQGKGSIEAVVSVDRKSGRATLKMREAGSDSGEAIAGVCSVKPAPKFKAN